ncbi:MAG: DNA repair protein RecO [Clostridia bacterium]|nr:DNA repair protein RecO [Clostridia bacterium]
MNRELTGLVIKTVNIGESDRLITVFTNELGVVSVMVRGARSLKSRKMSSTMQFCYSKLVLQQRGEYYYLKESELIENFYGIRNSLEGLALAGYIAEVLSDVTVAEPEPDLLRLSLNTLYAISMSKYPLDRIKAAFEIRAAAILGFMPDVSSCSFCGQREGAFYFDIMGGSLLCRECKLSLEKKHAEPENPHESRIICMLSETAKVALEYCVYAPLEKLFSFNVPKEDMELFAKATESYIVNQLERSYKTLDFYKSLIGTVEI